MTRLVGFTLILAATQIGGAAAQQARTAVLPESVTVGGVFRVAVRVAVPPGSTVVFPDTLDVPADVEAAGRREVSVDSSRPDVRTYTAVFPMTAWKPGAVQLPRARVVLELPDGGESVEATFPPVLVTSVLPPDTAQIEPKPAKDVIGPSRLLWPTALGLGFLAALLLIAAWAWRRRQPAPVLLAGIPPRDAALAELDRIRRLGHLERGDLKAFYSDVTAVLRTYTSTLDRRWGPDLTTPELARAMAPADAREAATAEAPAAPLDGGPVTAEGVSELISVLGRSDLVKFAAMRPPAAEAERIWGESRRWVEANPPGLLEAPEAG